MSNTTTTLEFEGHDVLVKAVNALQPAGKRTIFTKFTALHSSIEQALARGVTQRAIVETLEQDGLKLHPAKFKKLLEQARALRHDNGEGLHCRVCGSIQPTPAATEAPHDEGGEE
ncbi:hypothetical protein ACSFA0_14720 [Variovorax sp. LT1P1]|uniref:hypothetical protein n=1 Tax=Variovorax sp. LT1P1 TaxID=3443730 RepID=UPI003F45F470